MNPYPTHHPKVRGGFSPLSTGQWTAQGLAGLGITECDKDGNCYVDGVLSTANGIPTWLGGGLGIPTWAYWAAGGLLAFMFLTPRGR